MIVATQRNYFVVNRRRHFFYDVTVTQYSPELVAGEGRLVGVGGLETGGTVEDPAGQAQVCGCGALIAELALVNTDF